MEHYDCLPGESENVHSYPQIWGSITSCPSVTAGFSLGLSLLPFSPTLNTFAFWHGQKTFFKCIPSLRVCTCLLKGIHDVALGCTEKKNKPSKNMKSCSPLLLVHIPGKENQFNKTYYPDLWRDLTYFNQQGLAVTYLSRITMTGWGQKMALALLSSPVKKCNQSHKLKTF